MLLNLGRIRTICALLALIALQNAPAASDDHIGIALEGGMGEDIDAERGGIAFQSNWGLPSFNFDNWQIAGYWEASASYWHSDPGYTGVDSLADYGLTPFIRLQPVEPLTYGIRPFIEGGVGMHVMTEEGLNNKRFGSEFTFGNHGGAGVRYGNFDFSYRFQHLSNAGLADPNAGINFHIFRIGYHF